jgi:hypothetical protein
MAINIQQVDLEYDETYFSNSQECPITKTIEIYISVLKEDSILADLVIHAITWFITPTSTRVEMK